MLKINIKIAFWVCTVIMCIISPFTISAKFIEINLALTEFLSIKSNTELEQADSLKITGYFHPADISYIQENLSGLENGTSYYGHYYRKGNLSYLDLSEAKFADRFNEFNGTLTPKDQLPDNFGNGLALSVLKLPNIIIGRESFSNYPFLTSLYLSPNTEIGMYSFRDCDALENVFIPNGCKFSNTCFRGDNLLSFNVDPSNSFYKSVDGLLLDKSGKTLLAVPYGLTKIKVPDSVESVNWASFEWNPNIEIIMFGKNLTTFDEDPFDDNPRLDRVIIQSTTPINLPKNGSTMHYFSGCDHFKRCGYLYVPLGTKQYYEVAPGWENIPNIIEYSQEDLSQIYDKDIEDDSYGYEYDFKVDNIYYKVTSFENNTVGVVNGYTPYRGAYIIPDVITYNNRQLIVTSIISMNNGNITNLTIPNSVTSIGGLSNNSFESIILPSNLSELKSGVFSYCEKLKEIDIPESVNDIPSSAFRGCYNLECVNWRPNKGGANIGPHAFFDCISLKSFTFTPNMWATGTISTSGLGYYTSFYNCYSLESITFEEGSRMYFGYYYEGDGNRNDCGEFYRSNVKKVYLGSLYSNHKFSAGPHLSNLEELVIGDNIDKIKRENYYSTYPSLHGLKKLTIGAHVSEIETFSSDSIWVRNSNPPIVSGELSNDVYLNSKLYVPKGTIGIYQSSPVWKNFWNIQEFECKIDASIDQISDVPTKITIGIYDLNGVQHPFPIKGVNIFRYSDGTMEKVIY